MKSKINIIIVVFILGLFSMNPLLSTEKIQLISSLGTCIKGNCVNGKGTCKYDTLGIIVEGTWENSIPQQGKLVYKGPLTAQDETFACPIGDHLTFVEAVKSPINLQYFINQEGRMGGGYMCMLKFQGDFGDGVPANGTGEFYYSKDNYYKGGIICFNCSTPLYHGKGVLREFDLLFVGNFNNGYATGWGVLSDVNKKIIVISGDWENGILKNGKIVSIRKKQNINVKNFQIEQ